MKNKTVIITGGTKGIGKAIALALLNQGMNVCVTGSTSGSVEQLTKEVQTQYTTQVMCEVCDVRNYERMHNLAHDVVARFGKIDILIANAGVGRFSSIDEMKVSDWNDTIDVNLTGVFNSVKATVDQIKSNKGYIITIASLAGTNFFATGAAYNASKFGLVGFSQAIMLDLRRYGVKVTTIMPGSVSTHFNGNNPSEEDAWKIQPEDIAEIILDIIKMNPRTLPSKIEIRPSMPPSKK